MQTAFRFSRAAPATRARVFADADGRRAGHAADRSVAQVVERVVGHVVLDDVPPHVARRPSGQRVDLDEPELRVALDDRGPGARGSLLAPDGRDPGAETRQHLAQRLDLAQTAT